MKKVGRTVLLAVLALTLLSGPALFDEPPPRAEDVSPCVPFHSQCVPPVLLASYVAPRGDYWAPFAHR